MQKKLKHYLVYTLTCLINNKVYMGVTAGYNHRIYKHLYNLRRNIHCNCRLQADFNEHGENNFVFDKVSEYKNKFEALRIEKYYTDCIFGMNESLCYNIVSGGYDIMASLQKRYSDELKVNPDLRNRLKQRLSVLHKGKKMSNEAKIKMSINSSGAANAMSKKVLDANTGIIYDSLHEAAKELGFKYDTIRARMNGYNKQKTFLQWHH